MTDAPADERGAAGDGESLLAVEDLQVHYPITEGLLRREVGRVRAVDGVSFAVRRGEALGLVGESGSGKTTTAHAVVGLEEPTGGEVRFEGRPTADLDGEALQAFRRRVQLVVQDPSEAFNPRMTVGEAVAEPLFLNGMDDPERRRAIVTDLLERVGLSAGDADRYPHEFSGGEKQRIAIARALSVDPDLLVADEPTSALDARVQADVLGLLDDLRREFGISVLLVSHDLDVVRRFCDRVAVMYLGELVERGPIDETLSSPRHPYTRVLLGSVPSLDPEDRMSVRPLTDAVPDPAVPPSGCRFHTRCPEVVPPDDPDLSWDRWQSLASFRFTVETDELPPAADAGDAEAVRDAFDLPAEFPDADLDRAVDEAVSALDDGDLETARKVLATSLESVCERQAPTAVDADGRPVKCHRYDPSLDAEPRPWPPEGE